MTEFIPHPFEPLPESFSDDLHRIDGMIARQSHLDSLSQPEGLGERVFAASAPQLPLREVARPSKRRQPSLLLVQARSYRLAMWNTTWGRLAMAAMVGMAFAIGARVLMHQGATNPQGPALVARNAEPSDSVEAIDTDALASPYDLESAVPALSATGSLEEVDQKVAYLIEADNLTSLDDVIKEMQLLASLDM